jgi:tetratricopeptide (TPR) repeat protein
MAALTRSAELFEELEDLHRVAWALYSIGCMLRAEGDVAAAVPHLRRSAQLSSDVGDPLQEAASHEELGLAYLDLRERDNASATLACALGVARKRGLHTRELSILDNLERLG